MKHYVYKCNVKKNGVFNLFPWSYLITRYSCSTFYIKREGEKRARRVTRDYLRDCFPVWYKESGLFHVEQDKRG